jgi:predicted acylesterase/phospholipase RssA/CRP-like cAMP-binding protein
VATTVKGVADDRAREQREVLQAMPLFAELTADELDELVARCRTEYAPAGTWCVRAGDPSDALYIVVYGRLQVYVNDQPGDQLSRGHVFGEIGMISRQPRAAGVRAVRDTELLVLPAAEFDRLAEERPGWLRRVAQIVVDRLVVSDRRPAGEQVLTLGVFPIGELERARDLLSTLADDLANGGPAVVRGEKDAPPLSERARWAHQLESAHRFVVYDGHSDDDAWITWCLGHSDRIVLVVGAEAALPRLPPALAQELPARVRAGNVTLLIVHPPWASRPRAAVDWRAIVGDVPLVNVRRGRASDLSRAARLLSGRAHGLVLGGGGPRGFAHLGVMRALDEAGVPVDAIGGTSIGAVMGAFRALDLDAESREDWALEGFVASGNLFPPTLPVLSFSSARKVRQLLESPGYFGDRMIEETWLPYFCVSANLTRAEVVVHDRGPLATAVRASLSLPGIFPPVRQGADLLVDGGVLNNLPVDVMRERVGPAWVTAVDLSVDEEVGAPARYRETPSGWALLAERLLRNRGAHAPPLSLNVMMRAKELAGIRAQRQILVDYPPDLLIRPDVSDASMFDFKSALHFIDAGYRETMSQLESGAWTGERVLDGDPRG